MNWRELREEGANTQSMAFGNPLIDCFRVFYNLFSKKCVYSLETLQLRAELAPSCVHGGSWASLTLSEPCPSVCPVLCPLWLLCMKTNSFAAAAGQHWVCQGSFFLPAIPVPAPLAAALPLVLSAVAGTRWVSSGRPCATALGCYVLTLNIEESEELQSRSIGWGACGGLSWERQAEWCHSGTRLREQWEHPRWHLSGDSGAACVLSHAACWASQLVAPWCIHTNNLNKLGSVK